MSEEKEGDWKLRQELAEAHVAANNERAQRQAAEKHIEKMTEEMHIMALDLKASQDSVIEGLAHNDATEQALRNALRLISYLIKDQSDD